MVEKNNRYSKELKLQAVNMYINEGLSYLRVAQILNIKNKTQVQRWVSLYKDKGKTAFDEETRGKCNHAMKGRPKTQFKSIEEELKYLRMENEFLKKLSALSDKLK
ncbi:transposase [Paraclostridium bifermentans]|uniref:transposase n=1 Tax=Paraclostridium bifermentans TaxID=1490 RepID=UPI001156DBAC|nr:transposase [Paraclostridium bifermentans]TQO57009.1 transposase [Paraclostridium bifermentans]